MAERSSDPTPTEPQVRIERVFDAAPADVFAAWTEPERLMKWYAPHGCRIEFRSLDARPGGAFHSCIHTPDGHQCWCVGEYREVAPPRRLVFTMASADGVGNRVRPADAGMDPDWPAETLVTVTFDDIAGKTKLTLIQTVSESLARRTGAYPSWLQMFDRLAELTAGAAAEL